MMNEMKFCVIMTILGLTTAIGCVLMLSYLIIQNRPVLLCGTTLMMCGIMGIAMGLMWVVSEVFT